jgi:hypothetical protein
MLRRALIKAAESSSKRSSFSIARDSTNNLNTIHFRGPLMRSRIGSWKNASSTRNTSTNNQNTAQEEMPELTAFDAIGGLIKASTGGALVFGLGAVGVIAVASFAANVSKQFIAVKADAKNVTMVASEPSKRDLLERDLRELGQREDSWGNRRKQKAIKNELKKLVDQL